MSSEIGANYTRILARVKELNPEATLVSVSKTKPIEDLQEAFNAGCRVFGENYVDEIVTKSPLLPEAKFHMIGHLQSNKVAKLCRCPNLAMIQSIDSISLAVKVNKAWPEDRQPLDILIQVNTSDEEQKSGVLHSDAKLLELVRHIRDNCPRLRFDGLMTIGEIGEGSRDFDCLVATRDRIADAISVDKKSLKLSMGMSADYELALEKGADYVRVGSSIFGARNYHH